MKWVYTERPSEFRRAVPYGDKYYVLVYTTPDKELVNGQGFSKWALEKVFPTRGQMGDSQVGFQFDTQGGAYFGELTRINKNHPLGIVLDDRLISAPNINSQIGRNGVIEGGGNGFSAEELNYLVNTLSAGSLPAQLADEPISERTVGPQLGADNLRRGFMACAWGLLVVAIFLVVYYYVAGIVAFVAVVMNLILILGVMAMLNATFTLPGVAGIVLTIGAAVDANVLIFERLREEQQRGLSLRMAVRNAYDRAFSAIVDSNMTTVITSLVLVWMGSEEVRGFGVTLLIGLVSSLFTALFVTKTIIGIMIDRFGVTHLGSLPLTYPKWDQLLRPNIDWMGKIWGFVAFSVVFCVLGLAAFVHYYNKGEMLDIEFASGTSVEFSLKDKTPIEDVRAKLTSRELEAALPSPSVYSVGGNGKSYEVVTPNADSAAVRKAILQTFGDRLDIEAESHFAGDNAKVDDAIAKGTIVPITPDTQVVAGFTPHNLGSYRGGAAIVLKDLTPPLSPAEIKNRIGRQRLQAQPGQGGQSYRDFVVEADTAQNTPTTTAVVLTGNPDIQFKDDEAKWREDVVAPVWRLVNDAITKPAQLQGVKNFDPSVASDTMKDAIMALVLSVLIILGYIWLRFGNLIYGTATVVAMLHDTILVLAAIGMAHLLVHHTPGIANALLVEPFRLNLTIVASILTVMSYSMIDTIVVFDRVRENRGKYGHLDRGVINDSINQTLSRTLLTGGTNVVTVFVMYVMGGAGIHGFTFVLLFGIIVGTYSSIAIAAPFLLLHHEKAEATSRSRPVGQLQRA